MYTLIVGKNNKTKKILYKIKIILYNVNITAKECNMENITKNNILKAIKEQLLYFINEGMTDFEDSLSWFNYYEERQDEDEFIINERCESIADAYNWNCDKLVEVYDNNRDFIVKGIKNWLIKNN